MLQNPGGEEGDRPVYPPKLWEPYRTRRFQVGEEMYALLGIAREDKPARYAHVARNFDFFDAPVGLFFIIDERMGHAQWAHMGMFMQSIALAAVERGLATCMQEAWARVRRSLHAHFRLAEEDMLYCGMALGYAVGLHKTSQHEQRGAHQHRKRRP
jgi:nitroreductase